MSTDRELLELAARAAGVYLAWNGDFPVEVFERWSGNPEEMPDYDHQPWNPLTDDGDALRLAVRLDINLYNPGSHPAALHRTDEASTFYESGCARRSIVLAAAAIGRNLP